jgi:hypothetical protein
VTVVEPVLQRTNPSNKPNANISAITNQMTDERLKDSNMIAVRLATLDDAEVIRRQTSSLQQLHNEALPSIFKSPSADLFPPRKLAALIDDPKHIVAVAEIGSKVVGHIYGAVVDRAENEFNWSDSYLYIYQISVDDDARRSRRWVGRNLRWRSLRGVQPRITRRWSAGQETTP